ncbi:MAG: D-glycero-beta-D-manno-heptose 1-phosphate adenylyltransferase [Zetaproteobacteria bacterium]|nr:MAG: D-glycero-beta-D-manno-heptose 1-phosphate adenylyltransferase [Zetaproteobacteria bacterium]
MSERRILTREEAAERVKSWREQGLSIVFTNGCFDLLHPGHVEYLEKASKLGDRLVIGINDDASIRRIKGPTRPINPLCDRARMLAALRCVDLVVPFTEDTPLELIRVLMPDVLVKGGDYRPEEIVGSELVRRHGGQVIVMPFLRGYSSTALIERIRNMQV